MNKGRADVMMQKYVMTILLIMSMVPLCAMKYEKIGSEVKQEFLVYPKDAVIDVDEKKLPKGVCRFGNIFLAPKGFDTTLIHKTLEPTRVDDFKMEMIQ